jgi:hypothetical protein
MNFERQTPVLSKGAEKQLLTTMPGMPAAFSSPGSAQMQMLQKRARSKYFSFALAKELALCDSKLHKSYIRTLNCCSIITQNGKELTSTYCGARWCIVCNRIRTAKMLNKYSQHLKEMHQPHFITLTIPNCSAADIYSSVRQMQTWSRKTLDRLRKYGLKYKGFRKIEITYNAETGTFHPHLHILTDCVIDWQFDDEVDVRLIYRIWKNQGLSEKKFAALVQRYNEDKIQVGYFKAELLRQMWLAYFPAARAVAQDVRPANPGSLKELFKYSAKVLTKVRRAPGAAESWELKEYTTRNGEIKTVKKKIQRRALQCHVSALDKIYCALYNKRVLQPIGYAKWEQQQFNELAEGAIQDDLKAQEFTELQSEATAWHWHKDDWLEVTTGARLSSWQPGATDIEAANCFIFDSG